MKTLGGIQTRLKKMAPCDLAFVLAATRGRDLTITKEIIIVHPARGHRGPGRRVVPAHLGDLSKHAYLGVTCLFVC